MSQNLTRSARKASGGAPNKLPPTSVDQSEEARKKWTPGKIALWVAIALLGASRGV